uniref:Forminhomology 2 domaincontaining protein putative n=1 Tax=Albugo laibachii Nc14 TaxID=890382 RepID=F0WZA2_9STRA|nr:forminhomology 2 domaincontaining protein putative [Albugo laibachii Nc14]|eukprot:CCA26820.1 forminhomology 2 domaincontaining protein putative [Albugo laibachii Nc14]
MFWEFVSVYITIMWRRRSSLNLNPNPNPKEKEKESTRASLSALPSTLSFGLHASRRRSIYSNDPRVMKERPLIFTIDVPTSGPLGIDLQARYIEKGKPQRGAIVRGFRLLDGTTKGYVESSGRVKIGDILQMMHELQLDDLPFERIISYAMQMQKDPSVWPLRIEFRRNPVDFIANQESHSKSRISDFFSLNPAQDSNFNEKLQYFRGFFANRIPTSNAAKIKDRPAMPKADTVNEMYRDLLVKRGVPDDVMDELVRIEPIENKWNIVWCAQQHENDEDKPQLNIAEAARMAESLVELKWDTKGTKELEQLVMKISTNSIEWAGSFLDHFGLDYLTMKLPDPSPYPIEMSKFDKAVTFCKVLLCVLRSLTHFTAGIEALINVPGLVKKVALCFHTDDVELKTQTLQFLGIICYNSAAGHGAVIEAFDHYQDAKGEAIRFSCLRDALKSARYSLAFKEDVLSFINIIVNKAIRLEDRLAIRGDFMALKMAGYFEQVRAKSVAVQRQSSHRRNSYETIMEGCCTPREPLHAANSKTPMMTPLALKATTSPEVASKHVVVSPRHVTPVTTGGSSQSVGLGVGTPREERQSNGARESIVSDSNGDTTNSDSVEQLRSQLDNMEKQIEVFEAFMEDDRKDTIYETTDLSSHQSIFDRLMQSAASDSELQEYFLSILQQLLFYPADRVIGKEMWALSERLIRQVSLLAPVEEVREFKMSYDDRKLVLKLRDRYTEFLEKYTNENPSIEYHLGPIILLTNKELYHDFEEESLLDGDEGETDSDHSSSQQWDDNMQVAAQDHPDLAKYFKLLKLGMARPQVEMRMRADGVRSFEFEILETPDRLVSFKTTEAPNEMAKTFESMNSVQCDDHVRAKNHPKFAKFFKLLALGMPQEHVALKAEAEGVDSLILQTPEAMVDSDGKIVSMGKARSDNVSEKEDPKLAHSEAVSDSNGNAFRLAKDHELYSKYFDMVQNGTPMDEIAAEMKRNDLDSDILTCPTASVDERGNRIDGKQPKLKGTRACEHEKYAKYFKLLKFGMPKEQIKMKAFADGGNGDFLDSPDTRLNEAGDPIDEIKQDCAVASTPPSTGLTAKEHPKYAKFFKLLRMGMPTEQVKLKMLAEGLDATILTTPEAPVDADGNIVGAMSPESTAPRAREHPEYAKYFKLQKMGMPRPQLELRMAAEGLDAKYLDLPDEIVTTKVSPSRKSPTPSPVTPIKTKPKLRNLYWETLSNECTAGTIWDTLQPISSKEAEAKQTNSSSEKCSQNENIAQYIDKLTTLFVNEPPPKKALRKTTSRRRTPTRIALIDVKRANNIGIMLARFRLPYDRIREAVLQVDKDVLYAERVAALLQFAPNETELTAIKAYKGDPKLLGDAEQYFFEMQNVSRLKTRLQAIHATWQFDSYTDDQRKLMETVCNACQEVRACTDLGHIFEVVLSLGNRLNDGTARGGAKAFRLDTLLKLSQVKASDNSITLLNYTASILRLQDPSIIHFDEKLRSLEAASRLTMQMMNAGDAVIHKAAKVIVSELQEHANLPDISENDGFQAIIGPFADHADRISQELRQNLDEMKQMFEETVRFFGEDPTSSDCGPDSFFSVLTSFAKLLQSADRDNERKRVAEERRVRREEATRKRLEELRLRKQARADEVDLAVHLKDEEEQHLVSLKEGDVEEIMKRIRQKRVAEKREEILAKSFDSFTSSESVEPHFDST